MLNRMIALSLLLGMALSPISAWAQSALVLKSVSVDLPTGDRIFSGGATADAINSLPGAWRSWSRRRETAMRPFSPPRRRLSGWRSFVAGIDLLVDGGFTAV
jgi:hypothetical protein